MAHSDPIGTRVRRTALDRLGPLGRWARGARYRARRLDTSFEQINDVSRRLAELGERVEALVDLQLQMVVREEATGTELAGVRAHAATLEESTAALGERLGRQFDITAELVQRSRDTQALVARTYEGQQRWARSGTGTEGGSGDSARLEAIRTIRA